MNEVWRWIAENKFHIYIEQIALKDIAEAWERSTEGKRIVIVVD